MSSRKCNMCDKKHAIYQCPAFLSLSIPERRQQVSKLKLCFNCLKDNHQREQCVSTWKCKECNASHNSLLHQDDQSNESTSTSNSSEIQISRVLNNYSTTTNQKCFLSTAIIHVISASGVQIPCRVLLDSAAESNFITENMAQLLQLPRKRVNVCVRGISQLTDNVKHQVNANIKSMFNGFERNLDFLVLSKLTGDLPSSFVDIEDWKIPCHVTFADPEFFQPRKIDMILGSEIFDETFSFGDKIKLSQNHPAFIKTQFGWVVTGKFIQQETSSEVNIQQIDNSNSQSKNREDIIQIPSYLYLNSIKHKKKHKEQQSSTELIPIKKSIEHQCSMLAGMLALKSNKI